MEGRRAAYAVPPGATAPHGSAGPAVVIYSHQLVGALSGWITATRHNGAPRDPLRFLAATTLLWTARVTRRISPDLADELQANSFQRYCALNVVLERTAELSYGRLIELARHDVERDEFERIRDDETRHAEVFEVLADSFGPDDGLDANATAASIADRLRSISPWFVPAELRDAAPQRPLGRASTVLTGRGPVWVHSGRAEVDLDTVVRRCLEDAGIVQLVRDGARKVAIRTAFMLGYHRDDRSNIVSPQLIGSIARALREAGAVDVAVLEAPTIYGRYFANRAVRSVADYFGFASEDYRVVDVAADQTPLLFDRGFVQTSMCRTWLEADLRIVVPKVRTDPTEFAHLCLSTLEGMGVGLEDTIYADRQVDFRTSTMMLLDVAPPDAAVVDAWGPIADGPFGVMGCHRPHVEHRIYAGRDCFSVDQAVLVDLGLADASRAPIMARATHWFGMPFGGGEVHGAPGPFGPGFRPPYRNAWHRAMTRLGYPIYVYASRDGELFVPAIDVVAFPPVRSVPLLVRSVRRAAQLAFGLHPPGERRAGQRG